MVTTRSQSYRIREVDNSAMNRSSDNESEASFPDILSRDQITELDTDDLLNRQRNTDGYSIDQRFNEINRQIGDLTNIVLTLTQQFSSNNREGNRLNVATTSANSHSDNHTFSSHHRHQNYRDGDKFSFWRILSDGEFQLTDPMSAKILYKIVEEVQKCSILVS